MKMKTKSIVFNLDSSDEKELYDFCVNHTNNFSGFIKKLIFLYMSGKIMPVQQIRNSEQNEVPANDTDKDYMMDLF
jgi:hypothetical protein